MIWYDPDKQNLDPSSNNLARLKGDTHSRVKWVCTQGAFSTIVSMVWKHFSHKNGNFGVCFQTQITASLFHFSWMVGAHWAESGTMAAGTLGCATKVSVRTLCTERWVQPKKTGWFRLIWWLRNLPMMTSMMTSMIYHQQKQTTVEAAMQRHACWKGSSSHSEWNLTEMCETTNWKQGHLYGCLSRPQLDCIYLAIQGQ